MNRSWSWAPHVLAIELKKVISYRVDFWVQFVAGTGTDIAVAYFLWKAMFWASQTDVMQGFTLKGIVYYYLFASFAGKIARGGDRGYFSQDIYEGGLTRYLLYPLPYVGFKFFTHLSQQIIAVLQLIMAFGTLYFILGVPEEQNFSVINFAAGIGTCLFAGYLHFVIAACLEMVAFWQDVVWNLMVMLRFTIMLLGGGSIPLVFFPEWGQKLANATPFPLLIQFPVETFLGQITLHQWLLNIGYIGLWSLAFTAILSLVWARGTKQYSGVGI